MIDRRLVREAMAFRTVFFLAIGAGFLGGAAAVLSAWLLSGAIDSAYLGGASLADLARPLGWLLALVPLRAAALFAAGLLSRQLGLRIRQRLQVRLYDHLVALGPAYTRSERTGELATVVTQGVEALDAYFSHYLPQLALAVGLPLLILAVAAPLDPLTGLVLLLTAPLIPLFMVLIGRQADRQARAQWKLLGRMRAHFLDVLQGLRTLKTLGRARAQADTVARFSDRYAEATLRVLRVAFLSALTLELVATLSTAVVAVEIGLRLLSGRLTFATALFLLVLAPEFYEPLRALGARFHAGMEAVTAAARVYQVLGTPVFGAPGHRSTRDSSLSFGRLRCRDVHYAYQDGRRAALVGLDLDLQAGQQVALVGPSGSGKSTLAMLLLAFDRPDRGEILVDGQSLSAIDPAAWRAGIAWVPQAPYLFNDTLRANLAMARPGAAAAELDAAARRAGLDDVIARLPEGWDTPVGERGQRLSGGQSQRLALARAFLKDAPFLILDEPAASLDPDLEARLVEALGDLLHGRTALIIAHRLPTVRRADRIAVLEGGRVVERGGHGELLARAGAYSRLVAAYRGAGS